MQSKQAPVWSLRELMASIDDHIMAEESCAGLDMISVKESLRINLSLLEWIQKGLDDRPESVDVRLKTTISQLERRYRDEESKGFLTMTSILQNLYDAKRLVCFVETGVSNE